MFTTRKLTSIICRSAIVAGIIAVSSFAPRASTHADPPPLQLSSNIHCNSLTDVVTFFNNTASDVVANAVLQTSLQNSSLTATVPANGTANVTFDLTIGERLDKLILRDSNLTIVFTTYVDRVVTGTGECTRPAVDLVELTGYSLTCNNGVTHAAITVQNNGDYPASIDATGSYWFATEEERDAAQQAGLISSDNETFTLAPLTDASFALDFKAVDAILVTITNKQKALFTDGPRTLAAGEGCVSAPTTTVEETVPEETVPEETVPKDTTPQDTTTQDTTTPTTAGTESGAGTPTTVVIPTAVIPTADAAAVDNPRALPVTGRGSMPMGLIGAGLFVAGSALIRITRRRSA